MKIGLVLEGGGMRGVFTAGVLDYFMDNAITFPYAIGVSAGAGHGVSYLSQQRGRAKISSIDLLEKYQYLGIKHLIQSHAIFNQKLLYDRIPNEILPFDYTAAFANPMKFEIVVTNCLTGTAEYHSEQQSPERLLTLCKASASLPFVAPICLLDHHPTLDGGITDAIPVQHAIQDKGCDRCVVVLTRNAGYRDGKDIKMPRFVYKRYPRLRVALSKMHRCYNEQLTLIERLEESGKVLAIRPEKPLEVHRMETDIAKLNALYQEGYDCAQRLFSLSSTTDFLHAAPSPKSAPRT